MVWLLFKIKCNTNENKQQKIIITCRDFEKPYARFVKEVKILGVAEITNVGIKPKNSTINMIENLYLIPNFFLFSLLMNFKINFANNNFNAKNPNKKKF